MLKDPLVVSGHVLLEGEKGTKCKSNFKEIMTVAGRCSQNTNIESEHCPIEKEHSLPKASVCVPAVSFKVCTA